MVLQAAFYATPILYTLEKLPDPNLQQAVVLLNPLATIIVQTRHTLIDNSAPTAADAAGGMVYLLIPAAIVLGVLVLGFWVFNREAPKIAEEL